jgi:uncharacterized protein YaaN involved in tellurite resistance
MKKPIITEFCETIYRKDVWKYTQALEKYIVYLEQQCEELQSEVNRCYEAIDAKKGING